MKRRGLPRLFNMCILKYARDMVCHGTKLTAQNRRHETNEKTNGKSDRHN